ncbi:MAG: glycoside hydrolase family 16 protein [Herminiimonas sp.]|nr:glycoside hydrolase family 16 protein [Herminiimonas sp.]
MNDVFFNRSLRAVSCASLTALLLASCGGGGSSSDPSATASSAALAPVADASAAVIGTTDVSTAAARTTPMPATSKGTPTTPTASTTPVTTVTTPVVAPAPAAAPVPAPTATASAPAPFGQDASVYALSFAEEFDNGLNSSVWNDHIWYESSNATKNYSVTNGALNIWPQRDASGNFFNRTIDTDGYFYQTYGYFEIEAKLPVGKGTWPAFWLFNHIDNRRPEIDIMEAYAGGGPSSGWSDSNLHPTAYGATIWKDANVQGGYKMIQTPDLSAGFHKYAIKWEANKQTFYFDGTAVFTQAVTMGDPMYMMLDLWYGSASGAADGTTPTGTGNAYQVNYVRAWKFK